MSKKEQLQKVLARYDWNQPVKKIMSSLEIIETIVSAEKVYGKTLSSEDYASFANLSLADCVEKFFEG